MSAAIAPSTAKAYDSAFKHWHKYASKHNLALMPISPIDLGNCLADLADSSGSFATITTVVAAVAKNHWDRFLPSPTENFALRRLLQGFKRLLAKPPQPKEPLTPDILTAAIQLVRSSGRLQEWRTVVRMCLAFYAGCRWSDAVALRLSHLKFDPDGVTILIPKSKTDQFGKGETVYIHYANQPCCPVLLLVDYIRKLNYGDRDGFLQPKVRTVKGVQSGIWNTTVSYSTALSDLRLIIAALGLDPAQFGERSGRRGGATAASDAGVDWTDLMTHRRWKSVSTPLGYLANSRRRQRRVAQVLAKSVSSAPGSLDASSTSPVDVLSRRSAFGSGLRRAPSVKTTASFQPVKSTPLPGPKKIIQSSPACSPVLAAVPSQKRNLSPTQEIPFPSSSELSPIFAKFRQPANKKFAFEPLSNSDWIQAKQRYLASHSPPQSGAPTPHRRFRGSADSFQPSLPLPSAPIPIPYLHSREEFDAATTLASITSSPEALSPSTLDALFGANDSFELMLI